MGVWFHRYPISLNLACESLAPEWDSCSFFFLKYPPPPEIYTLPLPDALPIYARPQIQPRPGVRHLPRAPARRRVEQMVVHPDEPRNHRRAAQVQRLGAVGNEHGRRWPHRHDRSEEHTSELQSQSNLVCRLLLE